jgi:hypothetical protein
VVSLVVVDAIIRAARGVVGRGRGRQRVVEQRRGTRGGGTTRRWQRGHRRRRTASLGRHPLPFVKQRLRNK